MTRFMTLDHNGNVIDIKTIKQSDMVKCPHYIMAHEHYRNDGTCRCNDSEHSEMKEWGYKWKDGKWQ